MDVEPGAVVVGFRPDRPRRVEAREVAGIDAEDDDVVRSRSG